VTNRSDGQKSQSGHLRRAPISLSLRGMTREGGEKREEDAIFHCFGSTEHFEQTKARSSALSPPEKRTTHAHAADDVAVAGE